MSDSKKVYNVLEGSKSTVKPCPVGFDMETAFLLPLCGYGVALARHALPQLSNIVKPNLDLEFRYHSPNASRKCTPLLSLFVHFDGQRYEGAVAFRGRTEASFESSERDATLMVQRITTECKSTISARLVNLLAKTTEDWVFSLEVSSNGEPGMTVDIGGAISFRKTSCKRSRSKSAS